MKVRQGGRYRPSGERQDGGCHQLRALSVGRSRVNEELEDAPQRFNESPYEDGWLDDPDETHPSGEGLLDAAEYREKLSE